ncbi:helix-turn-helix domain-containing protein [Halomonas halmophila]|uniref:XRE family transcriptional regulator n=1 Tax=Halomonas halmophila TaxID=252 RepID=A0A4Y4EYR5_9GAMM|nr:cupin domain-containing protein [Halomonas halmophila]GED22949.1 XRE family transcriptional regulator [Halomonas halmophila]
MEDIGRHIAATLRLLRQQQGWSLDRTSRETGVSKAMLGQIERGESSPTVATLWKLASGFRVSLSRLLGAEAGLAEPVTGETLAAGSEAVRMTDEAGMQVAPLFAYDPEHHFEWLVVSLAPGAVSESDPHAPGVVEHLVVIEGQLELRLGDQWQRLEAGEGRRFAADQPHAYRNAGEAPARFHDVIHYPRA